jgi:hypothetical protein
MLLGAIHLDLADPTAIHHRQVGAQSALALCIGASQLMFQEFQRPHHVRRDGRASTRGVCGAALGARVVHGRDQGRSRTRLGPWAEGRRFGDEVCPLEARSPSGQPMLEVSSERPGRLS